MQLSKKIQKGHGLSEEGWGRLKASAHIGKTVWKIAIWYDRKTQNYLLPLKSEIRKKESITIDMLLNIKLKLESITRSEKNKFDTQ